MSNPPTDKANSPVVEQQRREPAWREAIASTRIEGGEVSSGAAKLMRDYALGVISSETAITGIKAPHGL